MSSPPISLIYVSYRPGSIDLLATSLASVNQEEYELIVVDDFPYRVQRGAATKYLLDKGINLGWYGYSKPHPLAPIKCGLTNAMNTGLLHCRTPYAVFLHDYCSFPSNLVLSWKKAFSERPKSLITGSAIVYAVDEPKSPGDVYTWATDGSMPPAYPKWPWVPVDESGKGMWEMFYFGVPLEFIEQINGLDERADHCICWTVSSVKKQARLTDWKLTMSQMLVCHMFDHREWSGGEETRKTGQDSLWRISGWADVPDPDKNEPDWGARSDNLWDFKESRRRTLGG